MGRAFEYRKASKFARWDKMAKAFTRAGKEITMAAKEGGDNPDNNLALRRAIQNAKAVQMPKDKIEGAIKRATSKDVSDFKHVVYEGMAPHAIAVVVEAATDNTTRTVANVRAAFNKLGGELGTSGMHDFIFDRKGLFHIKRENIQDLEEAELNLIDYGLESIAEEEVEGVPMYVIQVDFQDFGRMAEGLETLGIPSEKSELHRIPSHTRELADDQIDEVLELIDRLEQDDDVQNVFHNLA